jgi:hypothetical protein
MNNPLSAIFDKRKTEAIQKPAVAREPVDELLPPEDFPIAETQAEVSPPEPPQELFTTGPNVGKPKITYPKMLYNEAGEALIVQDRAGELAAAKQGWGLRFDLRPKGR